VPGAASSTVALLVAMSLVTLYVPAVQPLAAYRRITPTPLKITSREAVGRPVERDPARRCG
jgi:hypothetical protein